MKRTRIRRAGFVSVLVAGALLAVLAAPAVSRADYTVCDVGEGDYFICYVFVGPRVVQSACHQAMAAIGLRHKHIRAKVLFDVLPADPALNLVLEQVREQTEHPDFLWLPQRLGSMATPACAALRH